MVTRKCPESRGDSDAASDLERRGGGGQPDDGGGGGQPLLPGGRDQARGLPRQRDAHRVRLEGDGELLHAGGERPNEPGCGVVLPGAEAGGAQDRGVRRVLEGRPGRGLTVRLLPRTIRGTWVLAGAVWLAGCVSV